MILTIGDAEEDTKQREQFTATSDNAADETLEEPDKSFKTKSEVRKTWGFRRSTVAKREMPVEVTPDNSESRCPVRRSGRQSKRTDKLEEFLSSAKRASRKSAPPSLESGDPPSQTPTDAETASEASFDGNAETKAVDDRVESPERRTRVNTRKRGQRKTRGGRQTRSGGRTVKDEGEGSSDNEDDVGGDAAEKPQLQDKEEENNFDKSDPSPEEVGSRNSAQSVPEQDSEKKEVAEEIKKESGDKSDKVEMEKDSEKDSDEESEDQTSAIMVKRGPIRTYINKKKAANKNSSPVRTPPPASKSSIAVKKAPQPSGNIRRAQTEEENEDENDTSTSTSSSSTESDDEGYDPNALYCICRQKHNKRYVESSVL